MKKRQSEMDAFLLERDIEILCNHVMYFADIEKHQAGAFAEDTICDIQKYAKYQDISLSLIGERISVLKSWARDAK